MLIEPIKSSNPRSPGTLLYPLRSPDNCIRLVTECTHCKSFNLNINMIIHYHYICLRCPNDSCYIILYTVICFDMLYIYIHIFQFVGMKHQTMLSQHLLDKGVSLKEFLPTSRQPLKSNALNFPLKRWKHRTLRTHIKKERVNMIEHVWSYMYANCSLFIDAYWISMNLKKPALRAVCNLFSPRPLTHLYTVRMWLPEENQLPLT